MRRISPLLATALAAASLAAAGCTSAPAAGPGPGGSTRRTIAPGRLSPLLMPWPVVAEGQAGPEPRSVLRWEHVAIG
ncbi:MULTISPECIES: hypothetical protein [Streptomyces]|uniref:hypothetical protein n=1 Tax=Streptomyces TaxID=1883 RepID=UPI00033B2BEB|nr:hypothetical protein [Streptomyces noursei]AKA09144.1 hypothetical protein SAZ_38465 [Streptomyces noursei ZPM]AKA09145.1 hypothetical protein SAZ_38480 [Streptomyces noursei ZPM]EXU89904.1 hypothetical protein P354_19805 [Streptomyces noursei PD-1]UWS76203.1 hypothetical protein N1H47_36160 [Streptomyces noursei]